MIKKNVNDLRISKIMENYRITHTYMEKIFLKQNIYSCTERPILICHSFYLRRVRLNKKY